MKLGFFAALILFTNNAHASGCMWYTRYVIGKSLGISETNGKFKCFENTQNNRFDCFFEDKNSNHKFSALEGFSDADKPSERETFKITIESFEAMHWLDCDGTDTAPSYEKNTIYASFTHRGIKFESFKPSL